jgi:hypothetical protein
MTDTPKMVAARDQVNASVRDTFDRYGVNLHDPQNRMTALSVVWMVATAVGAFRGTDMDTPEQRLKGVAYVLESIAALAEDAR